MRSYKKQLRVFSLEARRLTCFPDASPKLQHGSIPQLTTRCGLQHDRFSVAIVREFSSFLRPASSILIWFPIPYVHLLEFTPSLGLLFKQKSKHNISSYFSGACTPLLFLAMCQISLLALNKTHERGVTAREAMAVLYHALHRPTPGPCVLLIIWSHGRK